MKYIYKHKWIFCVLFFLIVVALLFAKEKNYLVKQSSQLKLTVSVNAQQNSFEIKAKVKNISDLNVNYTANDSFHSGFEYTYSNNFWDFYDPIRNEADKKGCTLSIKNLELKPKKSIKDEMYSFVKSKKTN